MKTRPGAAVYNNPGTTGGTPAKWDAGITSLTDLAAVVTTNLPAGTIRAWIQASDGTEQVWRLVADLAGVIGPGVQPPNDWNASSNTRSWFKASS